MCANRINEDSSAIRARVSSILHLNLQRVTVTDQAVREIIRWANRAAAGATMQDAIEPDWSALATDMANAITFARSVSVARVVGRDGRVRWGPADLLASTGVHDTAQAYCAVAAIEIANVDPPTDAEALFMLGAKLTWRDWMDDPAGVRQRALSLRVR